MTCSVGWLGHVSCRSHYCEARLGSPYNNLHTFTIDGDPDHGHRVFKLAPTLFRISMLSHPPSTPGLQGVACIVEANQARLSPVVSFPDHMYNNQAGPFWT